MKGLKKEVVKNKNKGNRQPSGFAKPVKVTKELCEFMNQTEGTEIARTEVTRALVFYIKEYGTAFYKAMLFLNALFSFAMITW